MSGTKQSKYALRMAKLSGRIFAEYIVPKLPHELSRQVQVTPFERQAWLSYHWRNQHTVTRSAKRPSDLNPYRRPTYYPAHPQLNDLMATLREHGLYRDEHMDIKEEMTRLRELRGKVQRFGRGKSNKSKKKDD